MSVHHACFPAMCVFSPFPPRLAQTKACCSTGRDKAKGRCQLARATGHGGPPRKTIGKPWENHRKTMGNHGKTMGKPWETRKTMGKWWFNVDLMGVLMGSYPLVMTNIAMENGHRKFVSFSIEKW